MLEQVCNEFLGAFPKEKGRTLRGIGLECEFPVVTKDGHSVSLPIVQNMYRYLEQKGFVLEQDPFSSYIVRATRVNEESANKFDYPIDAIVMEVGFGVVELALAPQADLYSAYRYFLEMLTWLVDYFDSQRCLVLGYGIHPRTPPSRALLNPRERYLFYERFSPNHYIPKSEGVDAYLLTITASNQCHIEVNRQEAALAVNVLNAFSGLHIALHANSPIWKGEIDRNHKANREIFWEYCYPDRLNQIGIPPKFETIERYLAHLLEFKPMLVKRDGELLHIVNKETLKEFFLDLSPATGQNVHGTEKRIYPKVEDIHYFNTFCYYDARLVPKHGTIESRMSCQQIPGATLTAPALTLGLLENLDAARAFMDQFDWEEWKKIRREAIRNAMHAKINGESIVPLLRRCLEIAEHGLEKRGFGETQFLQPLWQRLREGWSPADMAISVFQQGGLDALLKCTCFDKESLTKRSDELLLERGFFDQLRDS